VAGPEPPLRRRPLPGRARGAHAPVVPKTNFHANHWKGANNMIAPRNTRRPVHWVGINVLLSCVVVAGVLPLSGCRQSGPSESPRTAATMPAAEARPTTSPANDQQAQSPVVPGETEPGPTAQQPSAEPEPPPKPTMPEVQLSESMQATCVVQVGDTMPGGRLSDISGQFRLIRELLGPRMTVVCFFSAGQSPISALAAERLLSDLQRHVADPLAGKAIQVIAISVGDSPEQLAPIVEKVSPPFPVLLDPARAYFALVAKKLLPRIYLLDSEGNVLWFDLAFTELAGQVRERLLQAITVALDESEDTVGDQQAPVQ